MMTENRDGVAPGYVESCARELAGIPRDTALKILALAAVDAVARTLARPAVERLSLVSGDVAEPVSVLELEEMASDLAEATAVAILMRRDQLAAAGDGDPPCR